MAHFLNSNWPIPLAIAVTMFTAYFATRPGLSFIILDLEKVAGLDIIGLGIAILALSISYLIIPLSNSKDVS